MIIFISNLQHPFPGTAEPCIFPGSAGLRVNNHSLLPCERKSIIIDLAQPAGRARAVLARQAGARPCTRGALTLTFPLQWENKGETASCATWLGKIAKAHCRKATSATDSTFPSPKAKHLSENDGVCGVSGRGEQSSCAEGSQHIRPCSGVFQAGRKPCFQRSGCNRDRAHGTQRAAADHALPGGVRCCPLGDAGTKTTGLCISWGAPFENGISVQKALTLQQHKGSHTQCYHRPVLVLLGVLEKPLPTMPHLPREGELSYPPPPHGQGDSTREASTAKLSFSATA